MRISKEQAEAFKVVMSTARDDAFGIALAGLMEYELDRVKELLVAAHPESVQQLQGQCLAYQNTLRYLKERTATIKQV